MCLFKDKKSEELYFKYKKDHDIDARNEFVVENIGLIILCKSDVTRKVFEHDAFINEACFSLIGIIDRFNPSFGYKFSSYAVSSMSLYMNKMALSLKRHSKLFGKRGINWSFHLKKRKVIPKLIQKYKRDPTNHEIAEELGVKLKVVKNGKVNAVNSLDEKKEGSSVLKVDLISSPSSEIEDREFKEFIRLVIRKAKLTKKQEYVLFNTYGLEGRERSMTEIADELDISRQAVFNMRKYAFMKLQEIVKSLQAPPRIRKKHKVLFIA